MKKKKIFTIICLSGLLIILVACNNSENQKTSEKELEFKKRELDLKQKELELKEKQLAFDSVQKSKNTDTKTATKVNQTQPQKETISVTEKYPEYLKKFIGTWKDNNGGLFDISYQNNKIKIRNCDTNNKTGVYYFGKYKQGKIFVDGYAEERFYKFQIPSFEATQNGELIYSDGVGDIILSKSTLSIDNVKREYELLNPVNND